MPNIRLQPTAAGAILSRRGWNGALARRQVMHVEFIRERAKEMPRLPNAPQVRTAKIWSCGFRSLEPLADCRNIEALEVLAFPGTSFDVIASLRNLSYLRIIHFPHIVDLDILGQLSRLESLGLESLPSWDSSGNVHVVESLQPSAG